MSESPGSAIAAVGTPVEMPVGMITSERRNPVSPSASRLMTTPEMIWSTRRLTLSARVQQGDEAAGEDRDTHGEPQGAGALARRR